MIILQEREEMKWGGGLRGMKDGEVVRMTERKEGER